VLRESGIPQDDRMADVHGQIHNQGGLDPSSDRRARAQFAAEATQRLAPDSPEAH
jgi:hypothetical protein